MANVGTSAVKIIDNDSDVVSVTNNKLDVNATLVAGATIDIGDVEVKGHASIDEGNNASISNSSATQLTGSTTPCKHVDVMAAIANTGIIYVGGSGVTAATGIGLYAGDVYSLDIDNVNDIYVLASVNGEDVQYVYYN